MPFENFWQSSLATFRSRMWSTPNQMPKIHWIIYIEMIILRRPLFMVEYSNFPRKTLDSFDVIYHFYIIIPLRPLADNRYQPRGTKSKQLYHWCHFMFQNMWHNGTKIARIYEYCARIDRFEYSCQSHTHSNPFTLWQYIPQKFCIQFHGILKVELFFTLLTNGNSQCEIMNLNSIWNKMNCALVTHSERLNSSRLAVSSSKYSCDSN